MPVVEHTDERTGPWKPTQVIITDSARSEILEEARRWQNEIGENHRTFIHDKDRQLAGRVGEEVFRRVFGGEDIDNVGFDVLYDGMKVEVKTLNRSVRPKPNYNAIVKKNRKRESECDLFYFISTLGPKVDTPYSMVWLCGYITPDEFDRQAEYWKKGEVDPENGFTNRHNCYKMDYGDLRRRDVPNTIEL